MNRKEKTCKGCKEIFIPRDFRNEFCSRSCAATFNNKGKPKHGTPRNKNCLNCGKFRDVPHSFRFCSTDCDVEFYYNKYIQDWKKGKVTGLTGVSISKQIRKYLFQKYNSKCAECGWGVPHKKTGYPPLEVEHINGDWQDNREENLTLLCPNCHALTDTFGGRNIGQGRHVYLKSRGYSTR